MRKEKLVSGNNLSIRQISRLSVCQEKQRKISDKETQKVIRSLFEEEQIEGIQ